MNAKHPFPVEIQILTTLDEGLRPTDFPLGRPSGIVEAEAPGAYLLRLGTLRQPLIAMVQEVDGDLVVALEGGSRPASDFSFLGRLPLELFLGKVEHDVMSGLARRAGEVFAFVRDREAGRGYSKEGLGKVSGILTLAAELDLLDEVERDRRFAVFANQADEYHRKIQEVSNSLKPVKDSILGNLLGGGVVKGDA